MAALTREDWCRAALIAFGSQGERAFAVEPLARSLGVTKGSFYWHFDSRAALVTAALELWRQEGTHAVIRELASNTSPEERLRGVFAIALRSTEELRAEAALQAAAARGHEVIEPVVKQVNEARLAYLADQYEALGQDRSWADGAFAAFLGACQLAVMEPPLLDGARREALVARMQALFVPGAPALGGG